jgi:hypothetical protein
MKLENSTDYSDRFLRRLIGWCAKQVRLPFKRLRRATYTNLAHGAAVGRAWTSRILVRIGKPNAFPTPDWLYHGAVNPGCRDRLEGLVSVTAHELRHLVQTLQGRDGKKLALREGECCAWERDVLGRFRQDRAKLEAAWSEPAERVAAHAAAPPAVDRRALAVQRREADARRALARWQAKLKLAQTKLKKYRRRVAYYDRRQRTGENG